MEPLLTAEISRDEVGVTLYCPELNIYTSGQTEAEVRRKFIDAIFEYWHFIVAHDDFNQEAPYREHLALLTEKVIPSLTQASLHSPHRPSTFLDRIAELFSHRPELWDADIFGSLVKSSAL